jgi:hypothetical protein
MKHFNARNIGGSLLGLLLLFGTVMLSSTTAQAQYWPNQDQYRRQREYERQRQAEIERQRQIEIERQRQIQQRNGTWNNGDWNNGTWNNGGWNDPYRQGNRGRRGRNGDGYRNYGGSYELRQTALNAGYNEGLRAGRDDRRRGRYNPQGSSAFRNASKDYNSRYGDRYAYQQYFRDAFINGYSDGYNYGY